MASSNSIFSSSSGEKRWVEEVTKILKPEVAIDIDLLPVCIFTVPKALNDFNPEAYAPQRIGLGPYHHLRPDLYWVQRQKLAAVKEVLKSSHIQNFQDLKDKLKEFETKFRAAYNQYIDLDGGTLICIMVIDGIFLLKHLGDYGSKDPKNITDTERRFAMDIMMLENQIPLFFLKETRKVLEPSLDDYDIGHISLAPWILPFFEVHSPLKLNQQSQFRSDTNYSHLLDYLYTLIVTNLGKKDPEVCTSYGMSRKKKAADVVKKVQNVSDTTGKIMEIIGAPVAAQKAFQVLQNLPWDNMLALLKEGDECDDENKPSIEEIAIPSVSQLSKVGVTFCLTPGGIGNIKYDEQQKTFLLPVITLNVDSEVILRNLVAYEASRVQPESTLVLAKYLDLMCGIVDSVEDVEILKKNNIIEGNLPNDEIAKLFNGISKSTGNGEKGNANLEEAIDKLNKQYNKSWKVKASEFMKKNVYASWKLLTFILSVLLLLLLILQAFCQVYGCSTKLFRGISAAHGLGFPDLGLFKSM